MYNYNQHLHFIGVGGVGMAGIAEVLLNLQYSLSGSDVRASSLTTRLEKLGAKIFIGHTPGNLPHDTSVVVTSSAIQQDNPELVEAHRRNIPVIPRAEMLAELMRMKYGVAVAGSHGKTTTTSMTAKVLRDCGFDPTVIIGGRVLSQESGASVGTGQYLVAEADESDGSFCLLRPAIAVVTNIDFEHLNHYGSFGALEEAFQRFMSSVPFYGLVVACFDDPVVARLARSLKRRVVSYGLSPEHDLYASDIVVERSHTSYTLHINGERVSRVELPLLGTHMVSNSLAAIAIGLELGAYAQEACEALKSFAGVARRAELVADLNGVAILDDYAHHPREIQATLSAIRQGFFNGSRTGRLFVLFQPHRFTRTKELFSDFLTCFRDADLLILGEIYGAGEEALPGISGQSLAAAVQHSSVTFVPHLPDAIGALVSKLEPGDVVVTVGAGSIGNIAQQIASAMREPSYAANG